MMSPQELQPGDRVVELAAVAVSAAVFTGALFGAYLGWLVKKAWLVSVEALVTGLVSGWMVGEAIAQLVYLPAGGNTTLVKAGAASLSATIPAGLAGGVAAGIVTGLLGVWALGARKQSIPLLGFALGCGVILGTLIACLGSLL
jgi:hypothetical protein